jgi:hypothetical protein
MPSHTAASSLIQLYFCKGHEGAPWIWEQWQLITGIKHGLFPEDDRFLPYGWTRLDSDDICSYFNHYQSLDTEENKKKFVVGSRGGGVFPGRDKWRAFINGNWEKWNVHDRIVRVLRDLHIHPISIMIEEGSLEKWPSADTYLQIAVDGIASTLFGSESFGGREILPMDLRRTVIDIGQRSWARIRGKVNGDKKRLKQLDDLAMKAFNGRVSVAFLMHSIDNVVADLDKQQPTRASINVTMRAVSNWKDLAGVYGTTENIEKAESMLSEIERLLELCGAEVKKRSKETRPAKSMYTYPFRRLRRPNFAAELFNDKMIKHVATSDDILLLTRAYDEYFNDNADEDGPLIDSNDLLPFEFEDTGDSDLGMEEERALDPQTLAANLGFTRQRLPYQFNLLRHKSGLTPWSDGKLFETLPRPDCLVDNSLHWHQLAGVHSIVRNIFTAQPDPNHCTGDLICDEVGLGKTALGISSIAFFNQCISLQERGLDLPPILSESLNCARDPIDILTSVLEERPFLQGNTTIESLPHLVICPGTLRNQWIREFLTLFRPHSVDIFVYDCPKSGNPDFWSTTGGFHASRQKPHNKVVFTTHSVCTPCSLLNYSQSC